VVSAFGAGSAGQLSTGGFGAQAAPAFGQPSAFGGAKPTFGPGGTGFGGSAFGNARGPPPPAFGAPPTFGTQAAKAGGMGAFGTNQEPSSSLGGGPYPGQSFGSPAPAEMATFGAKLRPSHRIALPRASTQQRRLISSTFCCLVMNEQVLHLSGTSCRSASLVLYSVQAGYSV
jgi:hypothetical protein